MNAGKSLLLGWTKYSTKDNWRWAKSTRHYLRVYNAAMKQLQTYDERVAVERQTRKRMKELEARQEAERNET